MSDDRAPLAPVPTPTERRERRAALIAALRSGEYGQTHGLLRDDVGFCCLGVAEHVRDPHEWRRDDVVVGDFYVLRVVGVVLATGRRSTGASEVASTVLSSDTAWWYGWREHMPVVTWRRFGDADWTCISMVELNDGEHLSLAAIADVVADQPDDWDGTVTSAQNEADRRNAVRDTEVTS